MTEDVVSINWEKIRKKMEEDNYEKKADVIKYSTEQEGIAAVGLDGFESWIYLSLSGTLLRQE